MGAIAQFKRGVFLTVVFILFQVNTTFATHLMGGSMTYLYQGMVGPDHSYRVTLKIYRYCDATGGGTAPHDFSMMLGIYHQDPLNPNDDKIWYRTETLSRVSMNFITPPSPGADCPFSTTVCVEEGIFEATVLLPPSTGGYHLMVERCCRNGNIVNLSTPGSIGQTYYCFIPPAPIINSSPQFSDIPVPFICIGDLITIVNNAVDPDGDSLVYSFEIPFSGYSGTFNPVPDPQFDNNPYGMPIPGVLYNPGYSVNMPFGAAGTSTIDIQTGLTEYFIPNQGFFVVAIEIKEYRNGILIASVRRDLQLIAIVCPVNAVPVISAAGGAGQTNFTINEGQTLCFPVAFVDPNGDSLFLTSSGNIFNAAIVNPPASLPNANGDGFVTSQFCWSTECGMAQAAPYQFVASVIDNGCPPKVANQIFSIKVNPSPIPPAPAVDIVQVPPGPICIGTEVTFTAIPTFGGTSPVYQWQLNGVNVGGNSNTYTSSTLANGDVITVSLISNSVCVNTNNANSPPVVMVVNPFPAPSVSINPVPAGPICAGTNVTFTAVPINPGPTPTYQWSVNGVSTGTNNPVFSSATLTMGSQVSVTLMSDPSCPAATSNVINMTVNPVQVPTVTITGNNAGAICPGQSVTFQAFPTGGGPAPTYQWQVNGVNTGANSNIFTTSTLNDGDNVSVILTSNESCVSPATANSNVINIIVTAPTSPSVSISVNPIGPVCQDDNLIFTATPSFGGGSPVYQWQVNGVNVGAAGSVWATSSLNNGDQVNVVMTSSLGCLLTNIAVSNIIAVTINPVVAASVTITANPVTPACPGTLVTFTAIGVNGGTNPNYQWQVNGVNTGNNSSTFSTTTLNNLDRVRVTFTSNLNCVSPVNAISNQITISVLPGVIPSVNIVANPAGPICQGTNVTFTTTPVGGGTTPVYQWTLNGTPVGGNTSTWSSAALNDGDVVRVNLTSSAACPVPPSVNSNQIIMDVNPLLTPSATISASPAFPVCDGTPVTFTALTSNGGTLPVYHWQVNGVTVAAGNNTITLSTLSNGDSIRVRFVSNAVCASPSVVYSNTIAAIILPYLSPVASISVTPLGPVCDGDSLFFTASTLNGGSNPSFQWFLNGVPAGGNSNSFPGIFNDDDSIKVVMSSSYQCLLNPTDTSNILVANILPNLTPSVSITVNPTGPVCPGDLLTFTPVLVNGGTLPGYQWYVNGTAIAATGSVFSTTSLQNGDVVRVRITSSEMCLTTASANSNNITVQISPNIQPGISINVSPPGSVCDGDTLSFTATFTGAGPTPAFIWRVNGIANGVTTQNFISNQLSNGDIIDVVLTSSAFCALPLTDTSNTIIALIDPLLSPAVTISADPPGVFCDGAVITYSAIGVDGGATPAYNWLLNGTSLGVNSDILISSAFLDGDTLQVIFTSSERCLNYNPAYSNLIIIQRLPPLLPVITAPEAICEGEEVFIEVNVTGGTGGPYYLNWNYGLGNDFSYTLLPAQTATYIVTASDSCSTPRSASHTIIVNPVPVASFFTLPLQTNILNPYFDFKDASLHPASWYWDFGDGSTSTIQNPNHMYTDPGYYTVLLVTESDKGCRDSTSNVLHVEDVVVYYVPNSFTPNGDGINDDFGLVGNSVSGYDLTIYGRWGQSVFISSGPYDRWNGNDVNGKLLPEGVYVYTISVHNDPKRKTLKGTVTLIR